MMKWLQKISTGRNVLLAVVFWLGASVCLFNFGPYSSLRAAGGGDLPEERFGYSRQQAQFWLDDLRKEGRALYRSFQLFDLANAALMASALTLLLSYVLQQLWPSRSALRVLVYLPLLVGALELLENLLLLGLIAAFPVTTPWMAKSASWVTSLKLAVSSLLFSLIVAGLLALGVRRLRKN